MQHVIINGQYLKHICGSSDFIIEKDTILCAYCYVPLGKISNTTKTLE